MTERDLNEMLDAAQGRINWLDRKMQRWERAIKAAQKRKTDLQRHWDSLLAAKKEVAA